MARTPGLLNHNLSKQQPPKHVESCLHQAITALQLIQLTLSEYKHIETFLESSAKKQQSIPDIFYYAVKSVVHPAEPLVEFRTAALKPLCVKALKRIFLLCDENQVQDYCLMLLASHNLLAFGSCAVHIHPAP